MSIGEQRDYRGYDLGGITRIRIERRLAPLLHKKLEYWEREVDSPDLTIQSGEPHPRIRQDPWSGVSFAATGGMPVVISMPQTADLMDVSSRCYRIVQNEGIYEIGSEGRITCSGVVSELYLEHNIVRPVINNLIVPRGAFLAHASAVALGRNVIAFVGETAKTSILLELLGRGASYIANEYLFLERSGKCTLYSTWMGLEERHLSLFPELMRTAYADKREHDRQEKRLSFLRLGVSLKGGNFVSSEARRFFVSRFHSSLTRPFDRLFPNAGVTESGSLTHVFLLDARQSDDCIARSRPEDIAMLETASTWIKSANHHSTLAEISGGRYCSKGDMNQVLLDSISRAECYTLKVGVRFERTRSGLKEYVDEIMATIE